MAVRLKDIALELGVSTVTVSKVLRGNTDVGEATRARVLKRMKELNYKPNLLARGLASGRTYTLGLVVPDLLHPFFAEFAKALGGELRQSGRALLLASSEDDPAVEQSEIETLLQRGVDVLLLASCQTRAPDLAAMGGGSTPLLLFDRRLRGVSANFVGSNDVEVGFLATSHLLSTGKQRIAHLGGRLLSPARDRFTGYKQALRKAGLPVEPELVVTRERLEEAGEVVGFQLTQVLLQQKHRPDALFCYNDQTAVGAMQAVLEAGLRIPEDIAIIGCGNMHLADYLRVPLSSMDHRTAELGRESARLALELSADPQASKAPVLLAPRLVVRRSTVA